MADSPWTHGQHVVDVFNGRDLLVKITSSNCGTAYGETILEVEPVGSSNVHPERDRYFIRESFLSADLGRAR